MKPKYRRFSKLLLPAVIVLPAMSAVSQAATIYPDGFGNITATVGNSGNNNISTGNGFVPVVVTVPPGEKIITIDSGVSLTPVGTDVVEVAIQDSIGATYKIINNGNLQSDGGAANYGISTADGFGSTPSITVENNGTISGAGAIRANDQLFLTNSVGATLTGTSGVDASVFVKNGGTIDNFGVIIANSHGIQGETGLLEVTNTGSITSNGVDGINTTGVLDLSNDFNPFNVTDSTITGDRNGVFAGGVGSIVNNAGDITGTTNNGVQLGAGGTVNNNASYSIGGPVRGGSIIGGTSGVVSGDGLVVNNDLLGVISGTSLYGISTGFNADIENFGTIEGGTTGVLLSGGTVVNRGLIQGDDYGVYVNAAGAATTLTNSGQIIADFNAFIGDAGNDIVNLVRNDPTLLEQSTLPFVYNGSEVWGDISGFTGTDTVNFSGGLAVAGGPTNIVHGDVFMENIVKNDGGVAFIGDVGESFEVAADSIAINGGGLYINGNISGLNIATPTITANGTAVGGTGTWNANVNVLAGGISAGGIPIHLDTNPEDAVGLLTIDGNVDHSPGSHLRVDIISGTSINNGVNSDLIVQNGAATYDVDGATVRVSSTNLDQVISQGTYTLVDSEQLITGSPAGLALQLNANTVDTGFVSTAYQDLVNSGQATFVVTNTVFTNYFAEAYVSGTDLLLDVDYENFDFSSLPGLSENQISVISGLGQAALDGNSDAEDLASALLFSDLGTVDDILAGLVAPAEAALAYSTSIINSNYRLHRQIADHLAVARSSSSVSVPMGTSVESSKGGTVAAAPQTTRGNLWGAYSYDSQDYDGGDDSADFDADVNAFTAGFDYRVGPNFIIGALLDGSQTDSDETGDIDSYRAAVYGTWGAPTGVYVDFLAGYGWHELDFTDANSWQANLTVGYAMGDQQLKHGPFAGLEYQKVDFDSFESGLTDVDDFDVDSFRALVGYRVNGDFGRFRPYASIAYAHEFEDGSNSVSASVFGGGFRVNGGELGSAVIVTAGTGIALTSTLSANIGYRGEISVEDEGLSSHGGTVGLNWAF